MRSKCIQEKDTAISIIRAASRQFNSNWLNASLTLQMSKAERMFYAMTTQVIISNNKVLLR